MTRLWILSVTFFLIGIIEFFIDEYQKIVSVRLKIGPTILFSTLNHIFDFIVQVSVWGLIIDFWNQAKQGDIEVRVLAPYLTYLIGCTFGSVIALIVYKKRKRVRDKQNRKLWLEKARQKKKQLNNLKNDTSVEVSEILDDELAKEDLKHEIIESVKQELQEETTNAEKVHDPANRNGDIAEEKIQQASSTQDAGSSVEESKKES